MDYPTNEEVLVSMKEVNERSVNVVHTALIQKFPVLKKCTAKPNTVYNKYYRLMNKVKLLKKQRRQKKLSNLLQCKFAPESMSNFEKSQMNLSPKEKLLNKELSEMKKQNKTLKRKYEALEKDNNDLELQLEVLESQYVSCVNDYKHVSDELLISSKDNKIVQSDIENITKELLEKEKKVESLESKYSDLHDQMKLNCTRNLNKKIKRRDSKIGNLKASLKSFQAQLSEESIKNDEKSNQLQKLRDKQKQMQNKLNALKRKDKKRDAESSKNAESEDKYLKELEEKIKEQENKELEQLASLLQDDEIVTFQDGRYCDEVREVIMDLLSLNVSMNKVNDVIRTVLRKLAGKNVSRLPSNAVKSRLLVEARFLSQTHVAESIIQGIDSTGLKGNCLHGDGTTKYHHHYQNFQITLQDGRQLSLGLKELAGGDSAAEMQAFTEVIEDLAETISQNNDERETIISRLIVSIKTTMSDHGPTNPCFNRRLKVLRETLIPRVYENWEELDLKTKESVSHNVQLFL